MTKKVNRKLSELVLESFYFVSEETRHTIDEYGLLFVLYDAGETQALKPLFTILDKCHVKYRILAFGTAWQMMHKHAKTLKNYSPILREHIQATTSENWPREKPLPQYDITEIVDSLSTGFIVTGMVSMIQLQIAKELYQRHAHIFSYYDSFSPISKKSIAYPFLKISQEVFVSTKALEENINSFNEKAKAHVVGQPSIDHWIEEYESVSEKSLYKRLHISSNQFTILYAGGYGDDYEEGFRLFVQSISQLDKITILLSLHPKIDGKVEKKILSEENCGFVKIVDKTFPTNILVKIADLVVTQRSTVGVQALFVHKPVVYLDIPHSTYTNFAIEGKWVAQVFTKKDFLHILKVGVTKHSPSKIELHHGTGIPKKASSLIFNRIQNRAKSRTFIESRDSPKYRHLFLYTDHE
jgi:CDP-Glycerol:Poly(glycerophosphate) glycerophosphotransferase